MSQTSPLPPPSWRTTVICLALLASSCANPSPSEIAQAEGAAATLESAADSACPNEASRIHEATAQLRELIRTRDFGSAALEMTALTALSDACKTEKENCGTGPARIGMTVAEAIHTSWCIPDKINRTETAGHVEEQWIYQSRDHLKRGYLYFDSHRLTAIQQTL